MDAQRQPQAPERNGLSAAQLASESGETIRFELVRAGHYGVGLDYLGAMARQGYRVGTLAALIRVSDHGVSPGFIRRVNADGRRRSVDELVALQIGGYSAR